MAANSRPSELSPSPYLMCNLCGPSSSSGKRYLISLIVVFSLGGLLLDVLQFILSVTMD
jgi:hypothetical protein